MRWFHTLLTVWITANGAIFLLLAVRSIQLYRTAISRAVRLLASVVTVVSVIFLMGSLQRIGLQMVEAGWLSEEFGEFLVTGWQLAHNVVVSVVAVVVLLRIRDVLERVDRGERVVAVLTDKVAMAPAVSEWGLTARELEVLEVIGEGRRSDDEIGAALFISSATAGTHVRNILRKAGLHNRNDLMFAVRSPR